MKGIVMKHRIILVMLLLMAGCQAQPVTEMSLPVPTDASLPNDDARAVEPPMMYDHQAVLTDVAGGTATGTVQAASARGYRLSGEFTLPEPEEGYFYEGWLVRRFPLSVISTGSLEQESGSMYTNVYTSAEDLSDYNQYVLTIEPDDGDPAPAEHVLEGTFEQL